MSNETRAIFAYLKGEEIQVDKDEFNFQFESHPDYPSLLSMSDALTFFNINNGALRVGYDLLDQLPDRFLLATNLPTGSFLSYVERQGEDYYYLREDSTKMEKISKEKLKEVWGEIVLLVEKDESIIEISKSSKINYLLIVPFLLLLGGVIWQSYTSIWHTLFYIFSFLGFIFSLVALKGLLNTKSAIFEKFCNATTATDCNAVINSSRWKIFERISFSDLSITFFSTQLVALLIMSLTGSYFSYFSIQLILLLVSIPVILVSVYYQKFVEKKWCPICLSIAGIVLVELSYLLYFLTFETIQVSSFGAIQFFLIYSSTLLIWFPLKKLLETNKELKEDQKKALRFKKNYSNFKNNLIAEERVQPWGENPLVFGNPEAMTVIDIVTSPFCGHCKKPHYMLEDLVEKHGDQLKVRINYMFNPEMEGDNSPREFFRALVHLRMEEGEKAFNKAYDSWLKSKDRDAWMSKYASEANTEKVDSILKTQYLWCQTNGFNFTPKVLVNGYSYPKGYEIADLPFFIGELVEDENF